MGQTVPSSDKLGAAVGGRRTAAGSTYGDFVPAADLESMRDPSRGAEMERDVMPPTADFSRPPPGSRRSRAPAAK